MTRDDRLVATTAQAEPPAAHALPRYAPSGQRMGTAPGQAIRGRLQGWLGRLATHPPHHPGGRISLALVREAGALTNTAFPLLTKRLRDTGFGLRYTSAAVDRHAGSCRQAPVAARVVPNLVCSIYCVTPRSTLRAAACAALDVRYWRGWYCELPIAACRLVLPWNRAPVGIRPADEIWISQLVWRGVTA